jgi:Protein of unknown function (DUF3221)
MRALLVLSVVVAAAACTSSGPPTREADISGVVTLVSDDRATVLVEERPQDIAGSGKASVRITADTRLWTADGRRASAADIVLGANVRVWYEGPVATSYPLQAKAGDLALVAGGLGRQLYALSKGGPAVVLRVNGRDAARLPCNGGAAIMAGADLVPPLPWDLSVVRESDGAVLVQERVTELPRWLLVGRDNAALSASPIAGPFVPCS